MVGFYERLVECNKMALRKSNRKKYLTQLQLQIFGSETEPVLNSRPSGYVGDDLNDGVTITPSYFLTLHTKTGTPIVEEEDKLKNLDYEPNNPSWKEVLLNTWKK